jgi:amino acid transporter
MESPEPSSHVALGRNLGLFTITLIGVGAMIGAGIFVLTGIAAGVAGPALLLVYLLFGLLALWRIPAWPRAFTTDVLLNGLGGVVRAMGLTFIAFEGY